VFVISEKISPLRRGVYAEFAEKKIKVFCERKPFAKKPLKNLRELSAPPRLSGEEYLNIYHPTLCRGTMNGEGELYCTQAGG
jgi:hypothetical protein